MSEKEIYPAKMSIKVFSKYSENQSKNLLNKVKVSNYASNLLNENISVKNSKDNKFISITFEFNIDSRDHLNKVYAFFKEQPDVVFVL